METNILDLFKNHGIEPRKVAGTHGGEYACACPACGGEDRFRIWPVQNSGAGSYWCRQCGAAGDPVKFLMDFNNLSFKEACERLNKPYSTRRNLVPKLSPKRTVSTWRPSVPDSPLVEKWLEKAKKFSGWANENLMNTQDQLQYLADRGIRKETAMKFRIGWNPGKNGKGLFRSREAWGLPDEFKAGGKKKKLWLPRGLVIPQNEDNQVLRLRIRRPEGEPRYYIIPGSSMGAFILGNVRRVTVVVESELDAILLYQEAGNICTIIALGSSSAKPDAFTTKQLRNAILILLALDYDQAGAGGRSWWHRHFPQTKRWPVPVGKDPGEAFQHGVDLKEWILSGFPQGWMLGRSALDKNEKRAESRPNKGIVAKKERASIPDKVKKFAEMIEGIPLTILHTHDRVSLRFSDDWEHENWELSREISNVMFLDPVVFEYIEGHPERQITPENIVE
jgi:hypothetical protein